MFKRSKADMLKRREDKSILNVHFKSEKAEKKEKIRKLKNKCKEWKTQTW